MPSERRFLHGTRQIIRFNWPRYVAGGLAVLGGMLLAPRLDHSAGRWAIWLGAALALWWMAASLAASWWTYDAGGITGWRWLRQFVGQPARWANIHAGFDETTEALRAAFPGSFGQVVDIYDPRITSEASIERARRSSARTVEALPGTWCSLPLGTGSQEAVFLLFAAHELRSGPQRGALFREAGRALDLGGSIVLVEHLRDWPNFVAFGPGFLHFHSRRRWLQAGRDSGLRLRTMRALNAFVVLMVWEKQ
jgi:hypothetical protein